MRFHSETKRLKDTISALKAAKLFFGRNRKQELIRLIYEISKKDKISPSVLLKEAIKDDDFENSKQAFVFLKDYFLRKRFPNEYRVNSNAKFYLPKLNIEEKFMVKKEKSIDFSPKTIFIENEAKDYSLTNSILNKFPNTKKVYINSVAEYIKSNKQKFSIGGYNSRRDVLFLIKERYDFVKPCPCSKGVVNCGYYILNLGFGCIYECSYCFLQNYTNSGGIILPVNIDDFIKQLEFLLKINQKPLRVGTGEFTDSLALDNLTNYASKLIDFFSTAGNATLELKTKSNNVRNILKLKHNKKTVISWSLNPDSIAKMEEWFSSSLMQRLEAARQCSDAGYLVGFHFDPIIYSTDWEVLYKELVNKLFKKIKPNDIAWISLGTFRFSPRLKTIIEQRFPKSDILGEELILDFDNKLRYGVKQRIDIYQKMVSWIRGYSDSVWVYLCMEPKEVWQKCIH